MELPSSSHFIVYGIVYNIETDVTAKSKGVTWVIVEVRTAIDSKIKFEFEQRPRSVIRGRFLADHNTNMCSESASDT